MRLDDAFSNTSSNTTPSASPPMSIASCITSASRHSSKVKAARLDEDLLDELLHRTELSRLLGILKLSYVLFPDPKIIGKWSSQYEDDSEFFLSLVSRLGNMILSYHFNLFNYASESCSRRAILGTLERMVNHLHAYHRFQGKRFPSYDTLMDLWKELDALTEAFRYVEEEQLRKALQYDNDCDHYQPPLIPTIPMQLTYPPEDLRNQLQNVQCRVDCVLKSIECSQDYKFYPKQVDRQRNICFHNTRNSLLAHNIMPFPINSARCLVKCDEAGDALFVASHTYHDFSEGVQQETVSVKMPTVLGRDLLDPDVQWRLWRRLVRKARIWKTLQHEGFLPLLGFCQSRSLAAPALVLPYINFGEDNLLARIKAARQSGKSISFETRYRWIRDITSVLAYLHEHTYHKPSVVHGDLRCATVYLREGRAILGDFGLSPGMSVSSSMDYPCRDVRWTAPEHLSRSFGSAAPVRATIQGDIFALGCTMLELFTEKAPFHEIPDNRVASARIESRESLLPVTLGRHIENIFPSKKEAKFWCELMTQCWRYDAKDRPTAMDILSQLQVPSWMQ